MIAHLFIFYASVAFLWCFYAWLYCDYRLDLLRYRLFLTRDRLFNYAEQGKIAFDSPAYLLTRTLINGSLRFGHRLTLIELAITYIVQKKYNPTGAIEYHQRLEQSLHGLSFEQKKMIRDIWVEIHFDLIAHIAHVSILLIPFAMIFKIAFKLHLLRKERHAITKKTRARMEPIGAVIYDLGSQLKAA